ncbi:hypothetical protein Tco_0094820, partial [Tanacetum coccineum]
VNEARGAKDTLGTVFWGDQVDYASRDAETLELGLRSSSNEQRVHDAQFFS